MMLRALITAIVEYALAFYVYKKGKYQKNVFFWVLFFLASYQLGEYMITLFPSLNIGIRFAYFSTTMLPPLGLLFLQKHTNRELGYKFVQAVGLVFAILFLVNPSVIGSYQISSTGQCIQMSYVEGYIIDSWMFYYQGTLLFSMGVSLFEIIRNKKKVNMEANKYYKILKQFFIAYVSFDIVALVISKIDPQFSPRVASLMCALAVFASFIFTNIAFDLKFLPDLKKKLMLRLKIGK